MGATKNLKVETFSDPLSHFGAPGGHFGFCRCCRRLASAPFAARLVFLLFVTSFYNVPLICPWTICSDFISYLQYHNFKVLKINLLKQNMITKSLTICIQELPSLQSEWYPTNLIRCVCDGYGGKLCPMIKVLKRKFDKTQYFE